MIHRAGLQSSSLRRYETAAHTFACPQRPSGRLRKKPQGEDMNPFDRESSPLNTRSPQGMAALRAPPAGRARAHVHAKLAHSVWEKNYVYD